MRLSKALYVNMNRHLILICILLISACSADQKSWHGISSESGEVDLAKVVIESWDRVCFFSPYSNNDYAEKLLGFSWPIEEMSKIYKSEEITLFVFSQGKAVTSYHEVPNYGWVNFYRLGGQCFSSNDAVFYIKAGLVEHVPKSV